MSSSSAKPFLLILLVLFPLSILGWHRMDTRPSSLDETRHMKLAMDYKAWMFHGVPLTNEWSHVYPPVYHLSLIPALSVGRPSEAKATATHIAYFAIFVAGCLLLGRSLGRPDWESVLAAFLCVGYCSVFWASRRALIDFPLMAWVTLSMAVLSCTQGFASLADSLLWGAVAGIGLLFKSPFMFFSVGPVLWTLFTGHYEGRFKNFLIALAVCVGICAPWYFWQGVYFLSKASSLAAESQGPGADPHTVAGWLFYIRLLKTQMGSAGWVFTLIGIFLAFVHRPRDGNGFLITWILSGYVILSLLANKDPRHTLGLLPPLAILAAKGWGRFAEDLGSPFLVGSVGPILLVFNMYSFDRPKKEDWKHAEILALMAQRHDTAQPLLLASVLAHQAYFFARTLKWSAMRHGIDLNPISPGDANASFTEFIVRRPGNQGSETAELDRQWQDLRPATRAFTSLFSVCGKFALPDHSEAVVYQRNPHPQFHVPLLNQQEIERRIIKALGQWIQGSMVVSSAASPQDMREGRLLEVHVVCSPCWVAGARAQKLEATIEKPWFNLYRLWDENKLGLLAFQSLKPVIEVSEGDIASRLASVKGLKDVRVECSGGEIRIVGRYKGIPVGATATARLDPTDYAHLDAVLERLTIAGIPLPGWILGKAHRQTLWLYPVPDFPGRILVNQITIDNGRILIS